MGKLRETVLVCTTLPEGGKLSVHLSEGKRGFSFGAGYLANVAGTVKGTFRLAESDGSDNVRTVQVASGTESTRVDADKAFDAIVASALAGIWVVRGSKSGKLAEIPGAGTVKGTDAPVTDAPVTDAPVTDAPVTDAPVTDAPATDAPATDAPATDAPATDAPATDKGIATGTKRHHAAKGTAPALT